MKSLKQYGLDKRVKLSDKDRLKIRQERDTQGTSYAKLATKYGVSKKLIIFICNPDKLELAKAQYKERRLDGRYKLSRYYSKPEWNKIAQDIRERHRLIKSQSVVK